MYSSLASNNKHQRIYDKILEEQQESPREDPFEKEQNPSIQQSPEQPNKIQMVIEFGHNASASLLVGPEDDPITLAKRFCFKNNIDPHVINTLASNIRSLQSTSFSLGGGGFKVERNCERFDDKQNCSNENILKKSRGRSTQKSVSNSQMKISRNKTNQSLHNESMRASTGPRPSSGYSVFERLYQDSRKKKSSRTDVNETRRGDSSRVSMNSQNKSMNESSLYGCLHIYEKNTKKKEDSFIHNRNLYESKLQKQIEDCSFQPQINPLSNLIATKLRQLDESSILNRTSNDKTMLKIKQYLLKKQQEQLKQCTFKPKIITKISQHTATHSQDKLYEDYQSRQNKKKAQMNTIDSEEQYRPKINQISKVIVKGNFFQRLEQDKNKRIEKQLSRQKLIKSNEKRKPSVGRPPTNRNLGDKTVGQYLYQKSKAARALSTKEQPQVLTDMRSSQIYAKSKQIAIQYIFELLDSNQDGLISSTKISIGALSEDVLRLLAPLLAEMEQVDVELNFQEFSIAFERLYSTFTIDEKNTIIKSYKNKQMNSKVSEPTPFNPTLNEQSLRIARELCSDDVDIYEASLARLRQKENKLNRLRAQRVLQQYSECTFHPSIHR